MEGLKVELVCVVPTGEGKQADVAFTELNGDRYEVRCLVKHEIIELGGEPASVEYLVKRYGEDEVFVAAQRVVLAAYDQKLDIEEVLRGLSRERPIFHSEADFQHALAWAIHERFPFAVVRPEKRIDGAKPMYIDVWVELGVERYAIELKYLSRAIAAEAFGEPFHLRIRERRTIWATILSRTSLGWKLSRGSRLPSNASPSC